jgi:ubiquinone/menaquinone biosynthesis C-methylase UbiE
VDRPMSDLGFRGMSLIFRLRDLALPREQILREVGIRQGFQVLDYGCGPGGYVAETCRLVGEAGKVYALDIHPLAVEHVQNLARRKKLTNVETIRSDCKTGLPDNSLDIVLLYDVLHGLSDPRSILAELHRTLKPDGTLSINDHHMDDDEIITPVVQDQLFALTRIGEHTYSFCKQVIQD